MSSDLLVALGLVLVIEGLIYAIAPEAMKRMVAQVLSLSPATLRTGGLIAAGLGLLIVWLVRQSGL